MSLQNNRVEVDLGFHGFSDMTVLDSVDNETSRLLSEAETWVLNFQEWLNIIRDKEVFKVYELLEDCYCFSLGLHFTDNQTIASLNRDWRQKNVPTDVLSFPMLDENFIQNSNEFLELGDIVVAVPIAYKQAKEHRHSLSKELSWLVCHGFLHLLGWDHPTSKSLQKMLDLQDYLIGLTSS